MGEKIQTVEVLKMNQVASIIVRAKSHSAFQNAMMTNVLTAARKHMLGVCQGILLLNQVSVRASVVVRANSHSAFQNAMMPNVETVARKLVVGVFHNVINCLYLYLCDGCCAEMLHISK